MRILCIHAKTGCGVVSVIGLELKPVRMHSCVIVRGDAVVARGSNMTNHSRNVRHRLDLSVTAQLGATLTRAVDCRQRVMLSLRLLTCCCLRLEGM